MIRHGRADQRSSAEAVTARGIAADPPLDPIGRSQADRLCRRLLTMPPPAAVYCSTLMRARQTIEPYIREVGTEVTYRDDLVEWFGGEWEFKEFEELLIEYPEVQERVLLQDPVFHMAPGGEAFGEFQSRVVTAIEDILTSHPQGDAWVVCHGGVINAYVGHILGIQGQDMFFLPPNASINTIKVNGARRALWFLADDTHVTTVPTNAPETRATPSA
jgi:2,3-bisphosphoglycerate-dependent phosphoglycerate mutase